MTTRRRFLTISAAALALPGVAMASPVSARWSGTALGAPASMTLAGVDPLEARPVFARLEAEIARLERIFSLYRPDSALTRLNRTGRLATPPPELLEVLTLAGALHRASGGVFDPTVQPLWQALAEGGDADAARALVNWDGLRIDAGELRLARPGMALTLNGVAQGYISDRIAALLKGQGYGNVLVDIGEIVALGTKDGGAPWRAGIAAPGGRILRRMSLSDRALATSATEGMLLGNGQSHILHPDGGSGRHRVVSVSARTAALADGLSTALCLLDEREAQDAIDRFEGARIEAMA